MKSTKRAVCVLALICLLQLSEGSPCNFGYSHGDCGCQHSTFFEPVNYGYNNLCSPPLCCSVQENICSKPPPVYCPAPEPVCCPQQPPAYCPPPGPVCCHAQEPIYYHQPPPVCCPALEPVCYPPPAPPSCPAHEPVCCPQQPPACCPQITPPKLYDILVEHPAPPYCPQPPCYQQPPCCPQPPACCAPPDPVCCPPPASSYCHKPNVLEQIIDQPKYSFQSFSALPSICNYCSAPPVQNNCGCSCCSC